MGEKINRTDAEWREILTEDQYRIMREKGTESPNSGKYYSFYEIPAIVSSLGGLGTYFSEVEGFGNNLLEMVSFGVPAIINKYDIYRTDIEHLGFQFPTVENNEITHEAVEESYQILTDIKKRNQIVKHNLDILNQKLDHRIIAEKLRPLIATMFTRILNLN